MPKNPFGEADPLLGAGGFGAGAGQAVGAGGDEYDAVEIIDDQPAAAPVPSGRAAQNGAKNAKDVAGREAALAKREQDMKSREAALAALASREAALASREAALASRDAAGTSCCAMVHHDINNDIPEFNKAIVRAGFMLFRLTALALTWNFAAVLIAVFVTSETTVAAWFFAGIYLVIGVPGAWFTWYGRLYRAMMSDGALSLAGFFFTFLIHTAFCIWSAVAPGIASNGRRDYAHAGWLPAVQLFKGDGNDKLAAICYSVGASLWTALSIFSVTYMERVYNMGRASQSVLGRRRVAMGYPVMQMG